MIQILSVVSKKQIQNEDMASELDAILKKAIKFAEHRNRLLHSHYHVTNKSPEVLTIERSGTRLRNGADTRDTLNPEGLFKLAEEMNQTILETETFFQDLMHYLNYDPEQEAYMEENMPEMTLADVQELFSKIGDLNEVDTSSLFLLGKKA